MKLLAPFFALLFSLSPSLASPQAVKKPAKPAPASAASNQKLPTFSGTWVLNTKRSKIEGPRVGGISQAVIEYDGKTWHYIHSHMENTLSLPDTWQTTMVVGSPVFHVYKEEPLTFRTRIYRQGSALVLLEYVRTDKGQRITTTTRYTLEDDDNTLIETEKSVGPLGTETNRWVLERQGTGATTPTPAQN